MDYNIRHHQGQNEGEFYAEQGSQRLGSVTYKKEGNNKMNIKETNVKEDNRHKGVGHDLVNHAVSYAKDKNMDLQVDCPFAKSCLEEQGGQKAA